MPDWIKDLLVPLVAAMVGGGAAVIAGYFTITIPQDRHQQREDARAGYVVDAFLQATKLAAAKIIASEPIGALGAILRQRTVSIIEVLPAVTVRLNPSQTDAVGLFHLMLVELDLRTRGTLDRSAVLFAYGAGATISLVSESGKSILDDAAGILAVLLQDDADTELKRFFGLVVDKVLPEDISREVRNR